MESAPGALVWMMVVLVASDAFTLEISTGLPDFFKTASLDPSEERVMEMESAPAGAALPVMG